MASRSVYPAGLARRLMRSRPRTFALLFGATTTVLLLLGVEIACGILNRRFKPHMEYVHQPPNVTLIDELGVRLHPNVRITTTRKRNGTPIFTAHYSTDDYGRRVTPLAEASQPDRFLLFFGCSYTFGTGVDDDETMPSCVARLAPRMRPYNYGVGGSGPQLMLQRLQAGDIVAEVDQRRGMLIYTFIGDHVNRVTGSSRIISWGSHFPNYTIDDNDRLVCLGSFQSSRPISTWVRTLIGSSHTARFFRFSYPGSTERGLRVTARIISESRDTYRRLFGNDEFYVLIYPGAPTTIVPFLEADGVRILDYSRSSFEKIAGDGHPTPRAHQAVAARLVQDLGIAGDLATGSKPLPPVVTE